jgi:hypothetical protein
MDRMIVTIVRTAGDGTEEHPVPTLIGHVDRILEHHVLATKCCGRKASSELGETRGHGVPSTLWATLRAAFRAAFRAAPGPSGTPVTTFVTTLVADGE